MGVEGRILLKRLLCVGWMSQHAGVHTLCVCVREHVCVCACQHSIYSACTRTCEFVSVCTCQHSACTGMCVSVHVSVHICVCAKRGENQ